MNNTRRIADVPANTPFFVVGTKDTFTATVAHMAVDSAEKEASRLAHKEVGKEFIVYRAVKSVKVQSEVIVAL